MKSRNFCRARANRFRVQAYREAANVLRRLPRSVADILNAKESRDWRKCQVSAQVSRAQFATSLFTAGLRCSIVSAAKARRLPFLRRCLA